MEVYFKRGGIIMGTFFKLSHIRPIHFGIDLERFVHSYLFTLGLDAFVAVCVATLECYWLHMTLIVAFTADAVLLLDIFHGIGLTSL